MNPIQELILATVDKGTRKKIDIIPIDSKLKDWTLTLSSMRKVHISDLTKNGPLLITFIRGTWCPFCRLHMQRLRDWVDKLEGKNSTIIVVSSESPQQIQDWLKKNPISYLFASDEKYELADHFGVRIQPNNFFQAATFLIDTNQTIRLAYSGKRTKKLFDEMESGIKESP